MDIQFCKQPLCVNQNLTYISNRLVRKFTPTSGTLATGDVSYFDLPQECNQDNTFIIGFTYKRNDTNAIVQCATAFTNYVAFYNANRIIVHPASGQTSMNGQVPTFYYIITE